MNGTHAENSHVAERPRHGSGAVARVLTVLYTLIMLPVALGLLGYGGSYLHRVLQMNGYGVTFLEEMPSGAAVRILIPLALALLLLASIAATGAASSAGLLAAGVLGLLCALLTAVPSLLMGLYQLRPDWVPFEVLDGLVYGFPLILPLLLGGLGTSLALARRRPAVGALGVVLGLLLIPVGLLAASVLLFRAHADGVHIAMRTLQAEVLPLVLVLVVLGAALLWVVAAASRWSPYALLIPALVLLAASVTVVTPLMARIPGMVWSSPTSGAVLIFLDGGGGIAAAVILLVHTVVLAVVRARARRRIRRSEPTAGNDTAPHAAPDPAPDAAAG